MCRCEEKHSVSGHVDGHSLSFSNRLPVRGSQRQCCLQRCQESGEEARLLPRQPIHVCRSTPLSFQPFCSPLLPVLGSPGPRSHCELCPAARSHPVEPAHPQPCDLPLGHNPRWRQTPPGLETLLGFKSPKAAMNSSFCPPASPLLCRSVPTSCGAAGNSRNPGPRPLLTLLDPPSLPQRPSSPTLCRRVLPAPGTASSRTHPGLPHLAGGDLLPHLAPAPRWELGLGYPPPAPPTHRYPFPTPASLSYLRLAQCSQPSLTSLPEIPVSMWGQHLAKPPDGPTPTRGGFCLYNFLHLCQEDWVPCPSLASHISSWASCWLDASSENPPLLLSSPCCFHLRM